MFIVGINSGDFATVAYKTATGQQVWDESYSGSGGGHDLASAVAVSPDSGTVFVTGTDAGHYATVAYAAATGQQLWASRIGSRAGTPDAIALSPDGSTVFVTGISNGTASGDDYATVAYAAATGRQLWLSRYNGRADGSDIGYALAVSPDGTRVYVTGVSQGRGSGSDGATIAYDASSGKQLWASRYNGHANGPDRANSVAVSRDGSRVFITGTSQGATSHDDIFTVAYAAASGKPLWTRRYNGSANLDDTGAQVLVSPLGGTVIAFGTSRAHTDNYVAIAYNAGTGATKWTVGYSGAGHQNTLAAAAFSPDGSTVYMTGSAVEFFGGGGINTYAFTVAISASTGTELWGRLDTEQDGVNSYGRAIAISPDGSTVYALLNVYAYSGNYTVGASFTTTAIQS